VVSNLVNRATVLLNYRLSDVAAMLPDRCPCGRALPLLKLHQGRIDDWIALPSGEQLHPQRLHGALKTVGAIWQWQLVQRTPRDFLVRIVAPERHDQDALREGVEREMRRLMGFKPSLEILFVNEMERTQGAKFRPVISLVRRGQPPVTRP
jgi:phenylacetate-CoA ligase